MQKDIIEMAFKPLREALKPKGSAGVTILRLKPGCAVKDDVPQDAIDEIIKFHAGAKLLGEEESACMKLVKILLMDSAYIEQNLNDSRSVDSPPGQERKMEKLSSDLLKTDSRPIAGDTRLFIEDFGYEILEDVDQPGLWVWTSRSEGCDSSFLTAKEALDGAWFDAASRTMGITDLSSDQWDAMSFNGQKMAVEAALADDRESDGFPPIQPGSDVDRLICFAIGALSRDKLEDAAADANVEFNKWTTGDELRAKVIEAAREKGGITLIDNAGEEYTFGFNDKYGQPVQPKEPVVAADQQFSPATFGDGVVCQTEDELDAYLNGTGQPDNDPVPHG
jgi:hypothetical protein